MVFGGPDTSYVPIIKTGNRTKLYILEMISKINTKGQRITATLNGNAALSQMTAMRRNTLTPNFFCTCSVYIIIFILFYILLVVLVNI